MHSPWKSLDFSTSMILHMLGFLFCFGFGFVCLNFFPTNLSSLQPYVPALVYVILLILTGQIEVFSPS